MPPNRLDSPVPIRQGVIQEHRSAPRVVTCVGRAPEESLVADGGFPGTAIERRFRISKELVPLRGIPGEGGRRRASVSEAKKLGQISSVAWALPPKGLRRDAGDKQGARHGARTES